MSERVDMTAAVEKPVNWHRAKGIDLVSYDDDSVWSLDVSFDSGERMGIELNKLAILTLASTLESWKEWAKTSPTGRRAFSRRSPK
jgi:hypothetical protein